MLKKYEAKRQKIFDRIIIFSVIGIGIGISVFLMGYIIFNNNNNILEKLGLSIMCFIWIVGLLIEKTTTRKLKKLSSQEIQKFEEKVPIGEKIPISIDWDKMEKEYNSLSDKEQEMFFYSTLKDRQLDFYLIRNKDLDGDSFTILDSDGSTYNVYSCMSRNYEKMIELTQKYYKVV